VKKIVFFLALATLSWEMIQNWPQTVHISGTIDQKAFSIRMSRRDKNRLDYFFRHVCFLNTWGYTFLGSKPMSINHYTKPWIAFHKALTHSASAVYKFGSLPGFREFCYLLSPEQLRLKLGFNTLKKYLPLFPDSRFAILSESYGDIVWFALVNKREFIRTVKAYRQDFEEVLLSQNLEPEDLSYDENLSLFVKNLQSEYLSGILLGFGRENAALFQKYRCMDLTKWPMASAWEEEDEQQLERINEKNLSLQKWELSDLFYPYFSCDPESEETSTLKQAYRKEREEIIRYYVGKDVVEATLSFFN
jgi:hypothetical protein